MYLPGWCPLGKGLTSPSTNSSVGTLYVLIRMVARGGQSLRMLWRATSPFRELNALLVSAGSTLIRFDGSPYSVLRPQSQKSVHCTAGGIQKYSAHPVLQCK